MKPLVNLEEINKLAPMPASVVRLAEITCDRNADMGQIAEVIQYDPALTANALRLANSAWSGAGRRIETAKDALLRLGVAQILKLAVGGRVLTAMNRSCEGYGMGEHELWRHSVAAALAAEKMSAFTAEPAPPAAFTACLIHDIGKLILSRYLNRAAVELIRETARVKKVTYWLAERDVLGTDHAAVGALVARHWKFPETLVNAIERHHDPDASPDRLLDVVHIANAAAKLAGIGLGSEEMNFSASCDSCRRLGLTASGVEKLCAEIIDGLARATEFWRTDKDGA